MRSNRLTMRNQENSFKGRTTTKQPDAGKGYVNAHTTYANERSIILYNVDDDDDFESIPAIAKGIPETSYKGTKKRKMIQQDSKERENKPRKEDTWSIVPGKENVGEDKNEVDHTQIRVSPRLFTTMLSQLTLVQKDWVKMTGWKNILNFNIKELPHKLGYRILDAFDHASSVLRLVNGNIPVDQPDVHEVLGFPFGPLSLNKEYDNSQMVENWRAQFDISQGHKITAKKVLDKLKEERGVTLLFKLNFLVLLTNTFVESNTNAFVSQNFLKLMKADEVDVCYHFNWCELLLESLVDTQRTWKQHRINKNYTGPLVFLIIFYVDRVVYKGKRIIPRGLPTYVGWTDNLLRQRSAEELKYNSFGKGLIAKGQYANGIHMETREAMQNINEEVLYSPIKMEHIEKVFFPIVHYGPHFYNICYNIKKPSWEIIDNGAKCPGIDDKYQHYPYSLHDMRGKTKNNTEDCGVLVMRQMETYKGEGSRGWDGQLGVERVTQKRQLNRLRSLYLHQLLTSEVNEMADCNVFKAEDFYKVKMEKSKMKKKEENGQSKKIIG